MNKLPSNRREQDLTIIAYDVIELHGIVAFALHRTLYIPLNQGHSPIALILITKFILYLQILLVVKFNGHVLTRKNRHCDGHLVWPGKTYICIHPKSSSHRLTQSQGFEAIKQLLQQKQPYKFILGARDTEKTRLAYDDLKFDTSKHSVSVLPLDLLNLLSVRSFAKQALSELGQRPLNYLFLIAGYLSAAEGPGPHGSQWCDSYVVNHLGMSRVPRIHIEQVFERARFCD